MDKFKTMTDEELIKTLKKYGITHGPVVDTTRTLYEKKLYEYERTKTTIPASSNSSYESREQYSRKDYNADNSTIIAQTPTNTSPVTNVPQEPVSDRAAETECNNYVVEIQHQKVVVEENQADIVAGDDETYEERIYNRTYAYPRVRDDVQNRTYSSRIDTYQNISQARYQPTYSQGVEPRKPIRPKKMEAEEEPAKRFLPLWLQLILLLLVAGFLVYMYLCQTDDNPFRSIKGVL